MKELDEEISKVYIFMHFYFKLNLFFKENQTKNKIQFYSYAIFSLFAAEMVFNSRKINIKLV